VGISGPGIYKHFSSKQAILAEMLIDISRHLLKEGLGHVTSADSPRDALSRLIDFHADFALSRPELIRVQEHDLTHLSQGEARQVRRLQRSYVEVWAQALQSHDTELSAPEARTRAHAVFGLLNSTPHSARSHQSPNAGVILRHMARAALELTPQ
jgi:AcrR family transcriptional regulator